MQANELGESEGRPEATGPPDAFELARYGGLRWNTPLSPAHAELLLERLDVHAGHSLLDLGCGWGELLLRALVRANATPGEPCVGTGVDVDQPLLQRGRARAQELGLAERVQFVAQRAETWTRPADRVFSIGSAHAWGDTAQALTALATLVPAGGRLLYGDGCWESPPGTQAIELFGDGVPALEEAVAHARDQGWHVLHLSTADQREWDEFESGWRAGRDRWLTEHPDDPQAKKLAGELDARTDEYLNVYRGVLGFCYLVLGR
jgi:SAM-dependent methyltransferase